MTIDFAKLREPFPSNQISWRVGATNREKTRGTALPYIDARVVQNRLDEVVTPALWRNRYEEVFANGSLVAVRCVLGVKMADGEWVEKEDAAQVDAHSDADSLEKAIKGVYSDALKRAAVQWGIGRYLYELDAPWADLDANGRLVHAPTLSDEYLPEAERKKGKPNGSKTDAKPTADKPAATTDKPAATTDKPAETPAAVAAETPAASGQTAEVVQADTSAQTVAKEAPVVEPPAQAEVTQTAAQVAEPEAERRAHLDAMADAAANASGATAPAVAEPASQGDEPTLPEDTSDEQRKLANDLLEKMKKLPLHMLRGYITGPKGQEKLTAPVRDYLMHVLAKHEAAASA